PRRASAKGQPGWSARSMGPACRRSSAAGGILGGNAQQAGLTPGSARAHVRCPRTLPRMARCPSCGEENAERAKFCWNCGQGLTPTAAPPGEVRKTVTILFADIVSSTSRGEQTDPESTRRMLARYFDAMRHVVEGHGGTVEKFIGDAVMAVFGIPTLHEDDALRAARAAHGLRGAVDLLNEEMAGTGWAPIALRIGVNTGEVVTGDRAIGAHPVPDRKSTRLNSSHV